MIRFTRAGRSRWVYWGTLHQQTIGDSRLQQFWFRLDDEPYWIGSGNRFRLVHNLWIHVGRASRASSHEEVLGGRVLMFTPREVRDWGVEEEAETGITGGAERTSPEDP